MTRRRVWVCAGYVVGLLCLVMSLMINALARNGLICGCLIHALAAWYAWCAPVGVLRCVPRDV